MNGYDRIYEMLLGEESRGLSRSFPGHLGRMRGHMRRVRSHPEFEEPTPQSRAAGAKGAKKSNKAKTSKPIQHGDSGTS